MPDEQGPKHGMTKKKSNNIFFHAKTLLKTKKKCKIDIRHIVPK
jgi:hypothetical protein